MLLPTSALLLAFRGPGHYASLVKLGCCWLLFALWVWTADWVNRDSLETRQNYALWGPVVFFPFIAALLLVLSPIGLPYVVGLVLLALAFIVPIVSYIYVRNTSLDPHQRVLTPDHIRYMLTGKEKAAAHELGAPVELTAQGGANERDAAANLLLARQSPGYVPVKDLIADILAERADAAMLDFTPDAVAVRYQVDGVWHNSEPQDREAGDAILEVLKTLAGLDRNERRKRQAGKFFAKLEKSRYTCRVTSQGTDSGERAVLALDPGKHPFHTLSELGMRDKVRQQFLEVIGGNRGFILFASLPSDGLSTTIDVSLEETDRLLRHFVTVEDEAQREAEIENVELTTFKRSAGETPATVLPKLVRTYPDVIVVRDLRDAATVDLLCKQVDENRLIIGSLRATSATDALLRVLALKASAAPFAQAITAALYTRLIRKLCEACKVAYEPPPELLKKLGITPGRVEALYREPTAEEIDKVCTQCGGIGYFGRTAIFELLLVNDSVRQVLSASPQPDLLKKAARAAGMRPLQEEGILLVAKGVTSLPELMRVLKQ